VDDAVLDSLLSGAEGAVHDDGEDGEHPDEDTEATAEDESDSPSLPCTKRYQRSVDPPPEAGPVVLVVVVMVMLLVVVPMLLVLLVVLVVLMPVLSNMEITIPILLEDLGARVAEWEGENVHEPSLLLGVDVDVSDGAVGSRVWRERLDTVPADGVPEGVGDGQGLFLLVGDTLWARMGTTRPPEEAWRLLDWDGPDGLSTSGGLDVAFGGDEDEADGCGCDVGDCCACSQPRKESKLHSGLF